MDREELLKHKLIFKSLERDYFKIPYIFNEMNTIGNMSLRDLTSHKKYFEEELPKNPKVFDKYLAQLIKEKGVSYSDVWKEAEIDSSVFSKYLSGKQRPVKDSLLRIIFALKLSLEEAIELLKLNNMALDENNSRDKAFWYCLKTRFSLDEARQFLEFNHIIAFT